MKISVWWHLNIYILKITFIHNKSKQEIKYFQQLRAFVRVLVQQDSQRGGGDRVFVVLHTGNKQTFQVQDK